MEFFLVVVEFFFSEIEGWNFFQRLRGGIFFGGGGIFFQRLRSGIFF